MLSFGRNSTPSCLSLRFVVHMPTRHNADYILLFHRSFMPIHSHAFQANPINTSVSADSSTRKRVCEFNGFLVTRFVEGVCLTNTVFIYAGQPH